MPNPPRLYINQPMHAGEVLPLSRHQAHYLTHVLRLRNGGEVLTFNATSGEWRAHLITTPHPKPSKRHPSKKQSEARLDIKENLRPAKTLPPLTLAFAPVKGKALDAIIRQGTELGATTFTPIITEFCEVRTINPTRLATIAKEAAEQCGRLCLPRITESLALADFIATLTTGDSDNDSDKPTKSVIFCDEAASTATTPTLTQFLAGWLADKKPIPSILLIGPEGGFSPSEREILLAHKAVVAVSLGEAILRADTATTVALGAWRMMHHE